jgi:hypothetical protein
MILNIIYMNLNNNNINNNFSNYIEIKICMKINSNSSWKHHIIYRHSL